LCLFLRTGGTWLPHGVPGLRNACEDICPRYMARFNDIEHLYPPLLMGFQQWDEKAIHSYILQTAEHKPFILKK
jgi:hypothetical protein